MKPLTILLAEDEVLIRTDMQESLEDAGHIVCGACGNGLKAIQMAKQYQPELVIMDIMMPELDGLEAAQAMYQLNIPVIMVTANSQPKLIQRAENVHVYGYIIKPVSEKNLLAAVSIAYAKWQEFNRKNTELVQMKQALSDQKLIEHARSVVQEHYNISAGEAHQRIIHEAMRRQMTVAAVAKIILKK